jgi:hypothetical protein
MGHSQRQLNQLSECLIALPPENDGMLLSEPVQIMRSHHQA